MFEETKQTLIGVSFVRRKAIIKKNQRVATRVVSRAEIIDRGRSMESIAKIAREKRKEDTRLKWARRRKSNTSQHLNKSLSQIWIK
jgi:hypothetical protein